MGQYYRPINLDTKQWMCPWDCDNLSKLIEHSWIGNDFVGVVMSLMSKDGEWFKKSIVWAGDYYGDEDNEVDYYRSCKEGLKIKPVKSMSEEMQKKAILRNHTKKLYVRYDEMPSNSNGWFVNPLPILTACGNGRGSGDYQEQQPDFNKVGIWAGDILSIETNVPKSQLYKKFIVQFKEDFSSR